MSAAARRLLLALAAGGGGFVFPDAATKYALFNGQNGDGEYKIGAATSSDHGLTWTEYVSNPVLTKGSGWESSHVKDPWLLWDGSQYVMYYAGYNGSAYQIGRATASSHNGAWTKYAGNPVLSLGAGGSFDDAGLAFPTVLYEPSDTTKPWKLWYRSDDGSTQKIAYAYSSDGISWTKVGVVLDVGTAGQWDDVGVLPGGIVKSGTTYYLFYGGRANVSAPVNWQGGLATFTDPEGTYARSASNPVLVAQFGTSGVSQALTSDTASGSAVVHVATTSHWVAGQTMLIADSNSESETHEILSIDSGTQVTLDSVVSSTFAAADGAVLRPFDINSVTPRSVRQAGSGFELWFAPFQGLSDLSVGGSNLREGSMRATATGLGGAWTRDDITGLLFPLFPATSGWHQFSAENPSVIAAP